MDKIKRKKNSATLKSTPKATEKLKPTCNHCQRIGHRSTTCRFLKKEVKQRQDQEQHQREEKLLLTQESINQQLKELTSNVSQILSNLAQLAITVKSKIFDSSTSQSEPICISPAQSMNRFDSHSNEDSKQPPIVLNGSSFDAKKMNKIDEKQSLHDMEQMKRQAKQDKDLFKLEAMLKPLKIDLSKRTLFKYPDDDITDFLDERLDPRLMLFTKHPLTNEAQSVFSKLSQNSKRYTRIRRWNEMIDDDEREWFLEFEERIKRKTEQKRNLSKQRETLI